MNKYQNNNGVKIQIIFKSLLILLIVAFPIVFTDAPIYIKLFCLFSIIYMLYNNINLLTQTIFITDEKLSKSYLFKKKEIYLKDIDDITFKFSPIKNSNKINDLVLVMVTKKNSNEMIGFTYKMNNYIQLTYILIQKCEPYKKFDKLRAHLHTYYKEII